MFSAELHNWSLTYILMKNDIRIPSYQRSYTWRTSHVLDLMKDISGREEPYLMGTIILHKNKDEQGKDVHDIVDGQQRLVTLSILLKELASLPGINIQNVSSPLLNAEFSESAAKVIRNAQKTIRKFLAGKSKQEREKLYQKLTDERDGGWLRFSVLVLSGDNALDQAYAFFDSVNSKGKPLSDFDLLKAHHLMFIPPKHEALAAAHNDEWQNRDDKHKDVFSDILRRLRLWARGQDRDSREQRPDYDEFRSVVEPEHGNEDEHKLNRYLQPPTFRSWRREGNRIVLSMDYPIEAGENLIPTEINQTIEGGDSFFIYAKRYHGLYDQLFAKDRTDASTEIKFVRELTDNIQSPYLKMAFQALMLLYFDKFGEDRIIEAAVLSEQIILDWRWRARHVRIEGTLSHVRANRLVPILLESINSRHACQQMLEICRRLNSQKEDELTPSQRYQFGLLKQFYSRESGKISSSSAVASVLKSRYQVS